MSTKFTLAYEGIPGARDGVTMLTICPPGTWMDNPDYVTFVGGSGVGRVETLRDAKELLYRRAVEYCDARIAESQKFVEHYQTQRSRLINRGLTGERKEPKP